MNLADARLGQAEHLRDFAQVQILAVIKRQHLALDFRQLFQPLEHQLLQFRLRNLFHRPFLVGIRNHFVKAARIVAVRSADGVQADELRRPDFVEQLAVGRQ